MDEPAKTRDPGWYQRPDKPHVKRYYDGATWTENFAPMSTPVEAPLTVGAGPEPTNAADFLVPGIALAVIGAALMAGGASGGNEVTFFAGCVAGFIGGLLSLVGVIAAGVRIGTRLADFDRKTKGG